MANSRCHRLWRVTRFAVRRPSTCRQHDDRELYFALTGHEGGRDRPPATPRRPSTTCSSDRQGPRRRMSSLQDAGGRAHRGGRLLPRGDVRGVPGPRLRRKDQRLRHHPINNRRNLDAPIPARGRSEDTKASRPPSRSSGTARPSGTGTSCPKIEGVPSAAKG